MLDHWPLIGRSTDIAALIGLITDESYRGTVLAGKPGVGKSRLAREVVRVATDEGWTVRRAAATATSLPIPLGAFAQWSHEPYGAPSALAHAVIASLIADADADRLLVFIDDAHLLDDLSALVVHLLVHSTAAKVIVTIRAGETPPEAVTALWKDGLIRRREVEPLSRRDTDALLAAVLGAPPDRRSADRLWRLSQGNVLFLRQLLEHENRAGRIMSRDGAIHWVGGRAVPGTLAELVDMQLGTVAEKVRDVVDLVAVAEPVDWHCLRMLADQVAIEEAEQRELIWTSDDLVYVGHPLYGEVRLNRCGPSRLRRLRGEVAAAMKSEGGAAQLIRRGLLWLESDLPPEPDVLLSAATAATSLMDFESAERLLAAAARVDGGAQARVQLAYNLLMSHKSERASQVLDGVGAEDRSSSIFLNDVVLRAANLLWWMRSPQESWRVIDEALLTERGPRRQPLLVFRALQLSMAGRPYEVLDVIAGVEDRFLDAFGKAIGLCVQCLAFAEIGQPDEAVSRAVECRRVIATTEQSKLLNLLLLDCHTFALTAAGHLHEAVKVAGGYLREEQSGPASAHAVISEIVGGALLAAGDLEAALRHLPAQLGVDAAEASRFQLAYSFQRYYLWRAQTLARCGEADAAELALKTARAHRHPADEYVRSTELLTEAWSAAARHRLTVARQLARDAAQFAREHDQLAREAWCLQTAAQFDDTQGTDRLAELAALVGGPRVAVAARYSAALSRDDALGLDLVSTDFEMMGDLLAAADAAAQAATSHRRDGRTGSALTAEARVRRLAEACGGATSPAIVAASFAAPFTHRELEIALLVAQGMSNRDIADAVSLSVRTVEGHIYRASAKAGVARRAELAEVIRTLHC
ncbi:LuxR C-terminal-related transcriptional regulator [Mycobacterium sp. B14F4]|uniref:helix-turn-helix transcriptional regulator n=1 Tax=Mycobacterium sp. B14F4 TaxID=3153565 RepID=UPI00325C9A0C